MYTPDSNFVSKGTFTFNPGLKKLKNIWKKSFFKTDIADVQGSVIYQEHYDDIKS